MTDTTTATGRADPSARHRLPYSVEPHRYELRLAPDLDRATFDGDVRIEATIHEPVTEIALHAAELKISSAELSRPGGTPTPLAVRVDEADERVYFGATGPLDPGRVFLDIGFEGVLNDKLHGFYRSAYTDEAGTTHVIATTQFEATDARRAFPCFDEPDRKAVFSVTLDVPGGLAAYSNGPEAERTPMPGGAHRIRFDDTIPMSTYLVAFVVGPLVATEPVDVDGTPVRIVHVPGKGDLTGFALQVAAHALRFFAEWFDIAYPGQKLDLVAIPDFAFGAMENLGCVTFREAVLLVDPDRASRLELERVADVVAHEIAHMWFGDLVTMKWWNGIWLNEAFATLMELLCVDAFRPDWQRWVSFGTERDAAMATDALHTTRPVEFPVGPPEEAQAMFDVLTYQKGAGVLRMLERYLGAEAFRRGIRRYLADHRLGNTETRDLWDAIERESGEPVRSVMESWILQGGFPLVRVARDSGATSPEPVPAVRLRQEPFAYRPADGPSAIGSTWSVPVLVRALGGGEARTLLGEAPATVVVEAAPDTGDSATTEIGPVVVNAGGSGYYRVLYEPQHQRELAARLAELEALERFNLLSDSWAALLAGRTELEDFLVLAEALGRDTDPSVWAQVTGALSFFDHALGDTARAGLARYARALLRPPFERLGWDPRPSDEERTPTLRAQLVATLGTVGEDPDVRAEAARRHRAILESNGALDPDLASAILSVVAAEGGPSEFDAFVDRYRHPATPQEEMRYLYALAGFRQPELAARAFELARTEVRTQNAPFLILALLLNAHTGAATWDRVRDHWGELTERIPVNLLPRMLDGVRVLCRDAALAREINDFLVAHPLPAGQRTVDQTLERLEVNVAFAARLDSTAGPVLDAGLDRLDAH